MKRDVIQRSIKRTAIVFAVPWFVVWGWVGWRGYEISHDATRAIDLQPPGAIIPPILLEALETGNRYLFNAVVVGALLPIGSCALAVAGLWIYREFNPPGHSRI